LKDKEKLAQEELLRKTKNKKEKTKTCREQCVFSYLIYPNKNVYSKP
jgi:hypothetical protein